MSKYIFACKKQIVISDLVTLGILPKQVSEYTDADIGSIISIPYTDSSGKILLNNGCIEFEVVGVNHHKDINDESKPTITLMTKYVIRNAAFDAEELNNPESTRVSYGNNRWSVSNIRQWLNSEGAANEWFTPQHEFDEVSTDYADDQGFLAGFSDEIKQHFATVRNKTILCDYDKTLLSKDFEETEDKAFLLSYTEIGFGNIDDNNPEGTHLAQKFIDFDSRVIVDSTNTYWMRTPVISNKHSVYVCYGTYDIDRSYYSDCVAPIIVLC
jgi:hypothetical protein